MKYLDLKEQLKGFTVFSLGDIRKIESAFARRRLSEWQAKGYLIKLRRGYYRFADLALDEKTLFLIANRLYAPSYISFEMALSYYGLIPEGVYLITSASTKKTAQFRTPVAQFAYHRVKPSLFFGYRLEKHGEQTYKVADVEKALLDYLYLNPVIATEAHFYEWRFNSNAFLARVDLNKLNQYAAAFKNKQLTKRLKKLLILIKNSA